MAPKFMAIIHMIITTPIARRMAGRGLRRIMTRLRAPRRKAAK
jgi:hypothetical protein